MAVFLSGTATLTVHPYNGVNVIGFWLDAEER